MLIDYIIFNRELLRVIVGIWRLWAYMLVQLYDRLTLLSNKALEKLRFVGLISAGLSASAIAVVGALV